MTKEEMIDKLERVRKYYAPEYYSDAIIMAIEAIKEPGNPKEKARCKVYARVPLECREYLREATAKSEIPMSEYLHRLIVADMRGNHDAG